MHSASGSNSDQNQGDEQLDINLISQPATFPLLQTPATCTAVNNCSTTSNRLEAGDQQESSTPTIGGVQVDMDFLDNVESDNWSSIQQEVKEKEDEEEQLSTQDRGDESPISVRSDQQQQQQEQQQTRVQDTDTDTHSRNAIFTDISTSSSMDSLDSFLDNSDTLDEIVLVEESNTGETMSVEEGNSDVDESDIDEEQWVNIESDFNGRTSSPLMLSRNHNLFDDSFSDTSSTFSSVSSTALDSLRFHDGNNGRGMQASGDLHVKSDMQQEETDGPSSPSERSRCNILSLIVPHSPHFSLLVNTIVLSYICVILMIGNILTSQWK